MATTGVVLAAGAGTRAGGPKALHPGWIEHACTTLLAGGCARVVIVLGAAPNAPVPADARITTTIAADWAHGMSRSLAAGIAAVAQLAPRDDQPALLLTLVDLPGLTSEVVARVLAGRGPLRQAVFAGRPGHPVFIAAEHWAGVAASLRGDTGARDYLVAHGVEEIECGELWDGADTDGAPLP
jgi:CTP:molybdopterin cytidylyltransferase MocA